MKNKYLIVMAFIAALLSGTYRADAQGMAINTTSTAADASAMLDVQSTSKGILIPRMTTAQRNGISLPANALLIYQTDGTAGFYFNSGTALAPVWTPIQSGFSGIDLYAQYNGLGSLVPPGFISIVCNQTVTSPTIGSWDGTTYTVGVTGTYLIFAQVTSLNQLSSIQVNVGLNVYSGITAATAASVTAIAYITAGTTISLTAYSSQITAITQPTNITIDKL